MESKLEHVLTNSFKSEMISYLKWKIIRHHGALNMFDFDVTQQ
jgi:hypothetical protein